MPNPVLTWSNGQVPSQAHVYASFQLKFERLLLLNYSLVNSALSAVITSRLLGTSILALIVSMLLVI